MKVVLRVAQKAGVRMKLFKNAQGVCCSQIWQHKGDAEGARIMANKVVENFYDHNNQ